MSQGSNKSLTNEQILIMFLKKHRKHKRFYTYKKDISNRRRESNFANVQVEDCISRSGFLWSGTKEGTNYWIGLSHKWRVLCRDLKLKGDIEW